MGKYNAYEKYKDSGVEWLGEIPEHWYIQKFIRAAFFQEGPGLRNWQFSDSGVRVICVTNITEKGIDFSTYQKFIEEEDYEKNYKHFTVNKNDLLLSSSGNSWGKVAEYNSDEIVILNTSTIRINEHKNLCAYRVFLKWALQSLFLREQLSLLMTGSCQPNFGPSHLAKTIIAIPPLPEQQAIANFLDYKTQQIDVLINKKETLLEKLDEKRTAIISHAVTKGLDPNVPMKDSGIEWLGEIPEHWKRIPFRWCCYITEGQVDPTKPEFKDLPLIAPNHIESQTGRLIEKESGEDQGAISGKYFYKSGTLLYSKIRPALVKACISDEDGLCSADMYPIQTADNLLNQFLLYQILSKSFTQLAILFSDRVAMPKINRETLGGFPVLVPPLIEQKKIIEYLDKNTAKIDQQKAKIQQAIDRLKEYRTALITNAVTGKIDVRQVPIP